ncbi:MAG: M28 family peptidase [Lachnospiraceae bacterium]|nr:M28 family peptidase [Lachnospiraceae bacterium]
MQKTYSLIQQNYIDQIDVDYAYRLAKRMEEYKTNPVLGFRTAGSRAEYETGEMLVREMKAIGLSQVEKDRISVDSWEFEKAVMEFTGKDGRLHQFQLGAYQTNFQTEGFQEFTVVDAGKGTAADYDGLDVKGKLVLADINQREEWWINFPVYQAHLKGAAALLAVQEAGYGEIHSTALNAQDIAGPADAPAFSISQADAAILREAMGQSEEGTITVRFDARSTVKQDQISYNITGRIPGQEPDSMILLSAHYDSYFSGFQDDNCAVAMMLGIARALLRSGYRPRKTIVFCAMAAEEWGISNSKYDWSTGAYQQVFHVHPEWQGKVIADLNFELPAHAHSRKDGIRSVYEYSTFLQQFVEGLQVDPEAYPDGIQVLCPIETWSDDFSVAISGIPSMVNDFAAGSFMETHYHSQFDNEEYYQEPVFRFHHQMYGLLVMAFDHLAAAPLDFRVLFCAMETQLELNFQELRQNGCLHEEGKELEKLKAHDLESAGLRLREAIGRAKQESGRLYERICAVNKDYQKALAEGNLEAADRIYREVQPLSREMLRLFKKAQEYFVRIDWHDSVLFPQESACHNLIFLNQAAERLKEGQPVQALECLYQIDNNRYAFQFEEAVFRYFTDYIFHQPKERLAWGYGRIRRHANLFGLVAALRSNAGQHDFGAEQEELAQVLHHQRNCFREDLEYMTQAAEKMTEAMQKHVIKK